MFSVYQLKPAFQQLLRPSVAFLAKNKITANQVTAAAFLLSCLVGGIIFFFAPKHNLVYGILPVFLFIRMALNAFDGMLAREYNQKSRLGAILNEAGDILSDLALYIPFFAVRQVGPWEIMIFSLLLTFTETAGIMGVQIEASRRYDGPMGKSDRAFWIGVLGLLAVFNLPCPAGTRTAAAILDLLMLYTIYNRFSRALGEKK